jgi:hypothetical protein
VCREFLSWVCRMSFVTWPGRLSDKDIDCRTQGHEVRLMPAEYVRPFVKSNKNDYVDAEAIAEAVQRPTMRFVPIKSEAQLDLQDRWMG